MSNEERKEGSLREQVGSIAKAASVINSIAEKVKNIAGPLGTFVAAIFRWYKRAIFKRFAYKDLNGSRQLSNERAATTILSSIVALFVIYLYGLSVVTYAFVLGADAYKVTFAKEETLYFNIPEYNSTVGFYEVSGCDNNLNCEGGVTSRIFEIKDNHWLDVVSHLKFQGGFDPKSDVVSSFSSPRNKCLVLRYRDRSIKYFGIVLNSEIYKASCEAVSVPSS